MPIYTRFLLNKQNNKSNFPKCVLLSPFSKKKKKHFESEILLKKIKQKKKKFRNNIFVIISQHNLCGKLLMENFRDNIFTIFVIIASI